MGWEKGEKGWGALGSKVERKLPSLPIVCEQRRPASQSQHPLSDTQHTGTWHVMSTEPNRACAHVHRLLLPAHAHTNPAVSDVILFTPFHPLINHWLLVSWLLCIYKLCHRILCSVIVKRVVCHLRFAFRPAVCDFLYERGFVLHAAC